VAQNENFKGKLTQYPLPAKQFYTVRELLTVFVDLTGPLTKKFVKDFAAECKN
jgi:hypothetical protein